MLISIIMLQPEPASTLAEQSDQWLLAVDNSMSEGWCSPAFQAVLQVRL